MTKTNPHLETLRARHRELDVRIHDEMKRPGSSDAEISKLKREKLRLKEQIASYETEDA